MAVETKSSNSAGLNTIDEDKGNHTHSTPTHTNDSPATVETNSSPLRNPDDRTLLLSRARSFLLSPQVSEQDLLSKRHFLREKGLHEAEIDALLHSTPKLLIPPRTYPQPAPSNLPNILLGLSRILSWVAGGSALVICIYYRFVLPRIAQSSIARHSLKEHHLTLMRQLTSSLSSFKESQAEAWSVLPKADPWREQPPYSECCCIDDIVKSFGDREPEYGMVPLVTVLRCGLADIAKDLGDEKLPMTEELFHYLEEKIPWLVSERGRQHEQRLFEVLSTCPLFKATPVPSPATGQKNQPPSHWSYSAPLPPDPSPAFKSLASLKLVLPKDQAYRINALRSTLETLSGFTGYISTQLYMPYRPPTIGSGIGSNIVLVEEQLRREIRALKGLVLNRRSFMSH